MSENIQETKNYEILEDGRKIFDLDKGISLKRVSEGDILIRGKGFRERKYCLVNSITKKEGYDFFNTIYRSKGNNIGKDEPEPDIIALNGFFPDTYNNHRDCLVGIGTWGCVRDFEYGYQELDTKLKSAGL